MRCLPDFRASCRLNWMAKVLLALLLAVGFLALKLAWHHPSGRNDNPFGVPLSDWYFVLRTSPGWLSPKWPYCGFTTVPDTSDPILTCDKSSPPLFSLLTFVSTTGKLPAVTGEPLLLLARATGLCGTLVDQNTSLTRNLGGANPAELPRPIVSCRASEEAFSTFSLLGGDLVAGKPIDLTSNEVYYMQEGTKFCGVVKTDASNSALVCDLNTTSGAMRFAIQPAAYPFASLASLATQKPCGVKSLLQPPPHELMCTQPAHARDVVHQLDEQVPNLDLKSLPTLKTDTAGTQDSRDAEHLGHTPATRGADTVAVVQQQGDRTVQGSSMTGQHTRRVHSQGRQQLMAQHHLMQDANAMRAGEQSRVVVVGGLHTGRGRSGSGAAQGEVQSHWQAAVKDDRTFTLTLILQKPGGGLTSGAVVGIVTYSPGLVGLPLQQCCPALESPHVVDCGVAGGDPLPAECWFVVYKVNRAATSNTIGNGDLVMLRSKTFSRYCSISWDGTLLCVSASPSNATRNLFRYSISQQ